MLAAAADAQLARPRDVSSLRYLSHGASPISAETLRRTQRAFPAAELLHVYGTTETTPITTLLPHEERILDTPLIRSCGQPAVGVEVQVVDKSQADVPPGAVGEIAVRGPSVMAGYWRKPEATAEVMRGDWYLTGDLGYRDEDSYIYLVDRAKDMIVSGGENIYSTEVEDALATHPAVREAAVFGVPDPRWGEAVYAVVFGPAAGDGGRAGRALPPADRRIQGAQVHRVARRAAAQVGGRQDPQAGPARTALGRRSKPKSQEANHAQHDDGLPAHRQAHLRARPDAPTPTARSSPTRPTGCAGSSSGPWRTARISWRPACAAWASSPATGSRPSPGTPRSTRRRTSPSPAWAR